MYGFYDVKANNFFPWRIDKKFTSLSVKGEKLGSNENQCLDKHETATFIEENTNTFPYFSPKMIRQTVSHICNEERNRREEYDCDAAPC